MGASRRSQAMYMMVLMALGLPIGMGLRSFVGENHPTVYLDKASADLGTVMTAGLVTVSFPVRNEGDATCELAVTSTEGVEMVRPSLLILEPGDFGDFLVGVRAPDFGGQFTSKVFIATTDPSKPLLELTIRGISDQPFTIFPRELFLGTLKRSALPHTTSFRVKRGSGITAASLDEIEVSSIDPFLAFRRVNISVEAHEFELVIEPSIPTGFVESSVRIVHRSFPNAGTTLPITLIVEGETWTEPGAVVFTNTSAGVDNRRSLRVKPLLDPSQIEQYDFVIPHDGCFTAKFSKDLIEIRFRPDETCERDKFQGYLQLEIGSGGTTNTESIRIPIRVISQVGTK